MMNTLLKFRTLIPLWERHACALGALINPPAQSFILRFLSTASRQADAPSDKSPHSRFFESLQIEYDHLHRDLISARGLSKGENGNDSQNLEERYSSLRSAMVTISKHVEKATEKRDLENLASDLRRAKDNELLKMTEQEILECEQEMKSLEQQIWEILLPPNLYDSDDIILEVVAGVGGQEAMLFSADIFHLYEKYAAFRGWEFVTTSYIKSDIGGIRSAAAEVSGNDAFKYMKFEAGVHRVQRVPKTDKAGRIHTSTTAVAVLPKPKDIEIVLNKKDLRIETCRSSGKGGQNVNKLDSAVRILHIPSGVAVECQEERNQLENKTRAMKRLAALLYQQQYDAQMNKETSSRRIQIGNRARSDKIRTYNFVQDRITDHRITESRHNIEEFFLTGKSLHSLLESVDNEYRREAIEDMISKSKEI